MSSLEDRYEKSRQVLLTNDALLPSNRSVCLRLLRQREDLTPEKLREIEAAKCEFGKVKNVLSKKRNLDSTAPKSKRIKLSAEELRARKCENGRQYLKRLQSNPVRLSIYKEKHKISCAKAQLDPAKRLKRKVRSQNWYVKMRADPAKLIAKVKRHREWCYSIPQFKQIADNAKKNKVAFVLTPEQVEQLTQNPCFYCGTTHHIRLDRKNSNGIYEIDNVLPCCTMCNQIKQGNLPSVFVERCRDIVRHQANESYEGLAIHYVKRSILFTTWAGHVKHPVTITEAQWRAIKREACWACGAPGPNGIDRIEAEGCYEDGNLQAACTMCNYMKWKYSNEAFIDQCRRIVEHHPIPLKVRYPFGACVKCNDESKPICYFEDYCCSCYYETFFCKKRNCKKIQ